MNINKILLKKIAPTTMIIIILNFRSMYKIRLHSRSQIWVIKIRATLKQLRSHGAHFNLLVYNIIGIIAVKRAIAGIYVT